MNSMKKNVFIIACLLVSIAAQAGLLEDIVSGGFKEKPLQNMTDIGDGEHYAVMSDNNVLMIDYRTGEQVDTLFSISNTKLNRLKSIDGFILSPTERYMLVKTNTQRLFRRSSNADWYIYDRQKKELKPLSEQLPVAEPRFSPNGKYIAFSRDNNIFIHKLDFSTEVAVTTDGEEGKIINGTPDWLYEEEFSTTCLYQFSPDSKQLAFVRLNETEVETFSWQTFLQEGKPHAMPQTHEIRYPRAGAKNAVPSVVVYDTYYKSLKTMQLPEDDDCYIPRIMWTTSADQLAVFRLNRNQNKMEMYMCNAKSAVAKLIYTEENKNGFVDYELIDYWQFYEDNTMLVMSEQDGWRHAYLYSTNGQKIKQLTKGNFDLTRIYDYEPLTQTLLYQAALPTPMDRQVFSHNVKKNKNTCLTPERGVNNARFSTDNRYMLLSSTSIEQPTTYKLLSRDGKHVRTLLDNQELKEKVQKAELPKKHLFSFTTERGDTLNGWILLPPALEAEMNKTNTENSSVHTFTLSHFSASQPCPLLLYQYSGPASQQVLNRFKIDWEEYLVLEKGYVVACVDPRGTNSRGRGFRNLTYMNIGAKEAEDQISTAKYLSSLGFIDSQRMAIWGWSYGGFQTLRTMSEADSPFRCGIAVAPVTDFRFYDSAYTERFMRRPQANENGYKAAALPEMAERLNGRVLLVHGVADDNVHCQNMWSYIDALVREGKQFDMQIYPDDNHFLRQRSNYMHLYHRMTDFLDNNL